jgi:drug/metabolite transporter (DMT)-like permease
MFHADRQNIAMHAPRAHEASPVAVAANLVTVYLIWGSTYLAIRIMVETLPPLLAASVRYLVAGVIMMALLWARARLSRSPGARLERTTRAQWRSAAIVGGLLLLGGNGFVVLSEQRIDSGIAAVLVAAVPIWMNLFDAVGTRRRPSALTIGGVIAGFAGVLVLLAPVSGTGAIDPLGIGLVLFASVSWALGSLYSRRAAMPRSGLLATGMEMLAGGALLGVAGVVIGEVGRTDPATFSTSSLLAVGYLVVFGSLIGFSAYTWLLQHAPVSTVATYAYVNPVVAVILGAAVLREQITLRTLLAAVLIIGAVVAMVTGRPREAEEMAPAPEPVLEPLSAEANAGEAISPDGGHDIGRR